MNTMSFWTPRRRRFLRKVVLLGVLLLLIRLLPPWWCGRAADKWWRGDHSTQAALARSVGNWIHQPLGPQNFQTGHATFDGEWIFGTYQMAVLGLGQLAMEQPAQRTEWLRLMESCEDRLLEAKVRGFDRALWQEDPLDALDGSNGHTGYLGYLNLSLSFHRLLDPQFKHRGLNDRITAALARNLAAAKFGLLETYPGWAFPVDNCAVAASLLLHDRAEGGNRHRATCDRWLARLRKQYSTPDTGLLIQAINSRDGSPADVPRGSGTLVGAFFLGLAGEPVSEELYRAARRELFAPFLGFGAALEYPPSGPPGTGDIDSGPLIFGRSVTASGFMLGCARQFGDEQTFRQLYRTVHLLGAPAHVDGRLTFASGGPLGDSMMLVLLTAQPFTRETGSIVP